MIREINANTAFLTLIAVLPLLLWGIWIVSVESFDELNTRYRLKIPLVVKEVAKRLDRNSQLLKVEAWTDVNRRNIRSRLLPLYFLLIFLALLMLASLLYRDAGAITPVVILIFIVVLFVTFMKGKNAKLLAARSKTLEGELPSQIQLLAILISAGVSPARSISILSTRSTSLSAQSLKEVVEEINNGSSIVEALDQLKNRFESNSLRRFVTSLILGIERGSALGPILIAQVRDSRLTNKSEIMRKAGKAEIGLMIPVVFLILPISILFALWPSYQQLGSFIP
jgi:Flp pilus assembly protein TadB